MALYKSKNRIVQKIPILVAKPDHYKNRINKKVFYLARTAILNYKNILFT